MAKLKNYKITGDMKNKSPNHQKFEKLVRVGAHPRQSDLDARIKGYAELLEIARKRQANPEGFRKPGSLNQHK